MYTFRCCFSVE